MARLLALATFLFAVPALAQPSVVGDWSGDIQVTPSQSLTAIFHIVEADSGLTATFDSPDQGAFGLPLSNVTFDGEIVSADLEAASASFAGEFNADSLRINGMWTQSGREMPLTLTPYEAPADVTEATKPADIKPGDYTGSWFGIIEMENGGEIHITFTLSRNEDATYNAILDAPGQAENMELGQIDVYGKEVAIDIMGQASYAGTISADERTMDGTFEQGGNKVPMTLTRR